MRAVSEDEAKKYVKHYSKVLDDGYEDAKKETHVHLADWIDSPWPGFESGKDLLEIPPTGIKEEILTHIGTVFSSPPPPELNFVLHRGKKIQPTSTC